MTMAARSTSLGNLISAPLVTADEELTPPESGQPNTPYDPSPSEKSMSEELLSAIDKLLVSPEPETPEIQPLEARPEDIPEMSLDSDATAEARDRLLKDACSDLPSKVQDDEEEEKNVESEAKPTSDTDAVPADDRDREDW